MKENQTLGSGRNIPVRKLGDTGGLIFPAICRKIYVTTTKGAG